MKASVGLVVGSATDLETINKGVAVLKEFGVETELRVLSAHRSPVQAVEFASTAREKGHQVIIAGAGVAAHLAGVVAAHTTLPVLGVPMGGGPLNGFDALLSTVQMPKGTPVGTTAIGSHGAINAALLAVRIIALSNDEMLSKLDAYQEQLTADVLAADRDAQKS